MPFEWQTPRLACISLPDNEAAKLFHRLLVPEAFLRVIGRGGEGREVLGWMADMVGKNLQGIIARVSGTVTKQTLEEGLLLAAGMKALLGVTMEVAAIETMKIRFPLLRNLLSQNSYWRETDKRQAASHSAIAIFKPEIESVFAKLQKEDKWPDAAQLAGRMLVWDEALPAGALFEEKFRLLHSVVR